MNVVAVSGRLVKDPEIKTLSNDKSVANFTLAVDRAGAYNSETSKVDAGFFTVKVWGKQVEFIQKWFKRGTAVDITGMLKLETWTKDDRLQQRVIIEASNVGFAMTSTNKDHDTNSEDMEEEEGLSKSKSSRKVKASVDASSDEYDPFGTD